MTGRGCMRLYYVVGLDRFRLWLRRIVGFERPVRVRSRPKRAKRPDRTGLLNTSHKPLIRNKFLKTLETANKRAGLIRLKGHQQNTEVLCSAVQCCTVCYSDTVLQLGPPLYSVMRVDRLTSRSMILTLREVLTKRHCVLKERLRL